MGTEAEELCSRQLLCKVEGKGEACLGFCARTLSRRVFKEGTGSQSWEQHGDLGPTYGLSSGTLNIFAYGLAIKTELR